ncbi:MAG: hypothetical protein EZS28_013360 [Streblomastix strix]|uniref:Uncharacterized protein n=1 Tax=Streblomastix strix TaxID=222440 RepID=A0A5J4W901_9EUKA|nr:MAG: hypothetical protein EZS28_013360 [Streblomastix strix]
MYQSFGATDNSFSQQQIYDEFQNQYETELSPQYEAPQQAGVQEREDQRKRDAIMMALAGSVYFSGTTFANEVDIGNKNSGMPYIPEDYMLDDEDYDEYDDNEESYNSFSQQQIQDEFQNQYETKLNPQYEALQQAGVQQREDQRKRDAIMMALGGSVYFSGATFSNEVDF